MKQNDIDMSEYMSLQIMEIENFRESLALHNHKSVSFDEAVAIWINEGFAEEYRSNYVDNPRTCRPCYCIAD
jgi:hypothetical protein